MKKTLFYFLPFFVVILFSLSSCAPVLSRTYMREGEREVSFAELRENPGAFKGRLYVFGGIIAKTKFTPAGSEVEAVHVPVDSRGYFEDRGRSEGRFLAAISGSRSLDPAVYRRGRRVTLAGVFVSTRKGRIDEMEYEYPVFEIKQIYLWPRERYVIPPNYYDPWFYPYPYYYWEPWWGFYYYSAPVPAPAYRPRSAPSEPQPQPQPRREREREHERR